MRPSSILINSIPKSGTYLLTQLVSALGAYPKADHLHFNDQHYTTGTDASGLLQINPTPAPAHLSALPAGHSAPAHLTWSQALEDALIEKNIGMFFMYRDPRDIVISYMKYAMYSDVYRHQTEGHRQYYEFLLTLPDDQRRAEHVLRHRLFLFQFAENAPWLFSMACMPISFEALYADILLLEEGKIGPVIERIMAYLHLPFLPCPPKQLFEQVHGKGATAMGEKNKIAVHRRFFDDRLKEAQKDPQFQATLRLYGYASGEKEFATQFNSMLDQGAPQFHSRIFWGDRMLTLDKSAGFMNDKKFADAYRAIRGSHMYDAYDSPHTIAWRLHTLVWAAQKAARLEGDFVECGVFKGDMAWVVNQMVDLPTLGKQFYLYDSFAGFSPDYSSPADYPDNEGFLAFADRIYKDAAIYPEVCEKFKDMPHISIIRGYVPESFSQMLPERIAYLHIDLNSPAAEIAALEILFDRVVPGGVIVFDDYGWHLFRKQKEAEDAFFAARGYTILELPTGQGLLVK